MNMSETTKKAGGYILAAVALIEIAIGFLLFTRISIPAPTTALSAPAHEPNGYKVALTPSEAVAQIEAISGSDVVERDGLHLSFHTQQEDVFAITLTSDELDQLMAAAANAQNADERQIYKDTWTTTVNSVVSKMQQQYRDIFHFGDDVDVQVDIVSGEDGTILFSSANLLLDTSP